MAPDRANGGNAFSGAGSCKNSSNGEMTSRSAAFPSKMESSKLGAVEYWVTANGAC